MPTADVCRERGISSATFPVCWVHPAGIDPYADVPRGWFRDICLRDLGTSGLPVIVVLDGRHLRLRHSVLHSDKGCRGHRPCRLLGRWSTGFGWRMRDRTEKCFRQSFFANTMFVPGADMVDVRFLAGLFCAQPC